MARGDIRVTVNHERRDVKYEIVERDGKKFLQIPEIDVTPPYIVLSGGVISTEREYLRSVSVNFWDKWNEEEEKRLAAL